MAGVRVFLVDGTYELFRYHYGIPAEVRDTSDTGATRGVVGSLLGLLGDGATHVAVATDHVIESFRNGLWPGYKSSAGMPEILLAQFPLVEAALSALGVVVLPMVDLEADDALASVAAVAAADPGVEQVVVCTPDKDLAQCVVDGRVVQVDRRQSIVYDEAAVVAKFGVAPALIPDLLALVGDSADGFPGLPGWGMRSSATALSRYGSIEAIPTDEPWDVSVRGSKNLQATLRDQRDRALLFKRLATLVVDRSLVGAVADLEWRGPTAEFPAVADHLGAPGLAEQARALAEARAG